MIHRRIGIRHTQHAGHAACQRSSGAGIDILFMRLAGIAEMNVHIKQSRQDGKSRAVDYAVCTGIEMRRDLFDFSVTEQNIADGILLPVNGADIADQDRIHEVSSFL